MYKWRRPKPQGKRLCYIAIPMTAPNAKCRKCTQATPPWQHHPQHHLTHSSSLSTGGCSGARQVAHSR